MEYRFDIDTKSTCWERSYLYVEADSFEEATEEMMKKIEDNTYMNEAEYEELLYDTVTYMNPEENGGLHTIEVSDEDGNIIFKNVP